MNTRVAQRLSIMVFLFVAAFVIAIVSIHFERRRNAQVEDVKQGVVEPRVVEGVGIFLSRVGDLKAFVKRSPHLDEALWWCPSESVFVSPGHGSLFDADGRHIDGPSPRDMDTVPIRKDGRFLIADLSRIQLGRSGAKEGSVPAGVLSKYQSWIDGNTSAFCAHHVS